jgi:hypothetical protein
LPQDDDVGYLVRRTFMADIRASALIRFSVFYLSVELSPFCAKANQAANGLQFYLRLIDLSPFPVALNDHFAPQAFACTLRRGRWSIGLSCRTSNYWRKSIAPLPLVLLGYAPYTACR